MIWDVVEFLSGALICLLIIAAILGVVSFLNEEIGVLRKVKRWAKRRQP